MDFLTVRLFGAEGGKNGIFKGSKKQKPIMNGQNYAVDGFSYALFNQSQNISLR